jgi:hypothetical protein
MERVDDLRLSADVANGASTAPLESAADAATPAPSLGGGGGDSGGEGTAAGESDLWGDAVNTLGPGVPFTPTHICAVYIRYKDGEPIIRQGYVPWDAIGEDELILNLLRSLKNPATPQLNVLYKRFNFENLNMSGQQVFVVYLDNKPDVARFLTADDIKDDPLRPTDSTDPNVRLPEHIIRFARFSGNDRREVQKNKAFYNIKPIAMPNGEFRGPTAYRVNYYNTDEYGNQWQDVTYGDKSTYKVYSMNIHLLVRSNSAGGGGSRMIPVILDPDTGNMGSQP